MNLNKNQQQQDTGDVAGDRHRNRVAIEAALMAEGFPHEHAIEWSSTLADRTVGEVVAGARMMRSRPRFQRGEISTPAAYIRTLIVTQVQTETLLAEHADRKAGFLRGSSAKRNFQDLSVQEQAEVERIALVLAPGGKGSPPWPVALSLAIARFDEMKGTEGGLTYSPP